MTKYLMLYPEKRMIEGERILMGAEDAFANGEIEARPESVDHAIRMLEHAGKITIAAAKGERA
jgi:hypothetical protein